MNNNLNNKTKFMEQTKSQLYQDPWNMEKGKDCKNRYYYKTKKEWWQLLKNDLDDKGFNMSCDAVFMPIVCADVNILKTNLLSVFDDICDTKEHADDFFRCHPSAKYVDVNSYLIRSMINGYGTPQHIVDMRGDAWYLIQEKMNELVKKWYGVNVWGKQKIEDRIFDPNKLNPEVLPNTEDNIIKTYKNLEYVKDRKVYLKVVDKEYFVGYCKDIYERDLAYGIIRRYDDEDMRYYTNDISFKTINIKFYDDMNTIIKRVKQYNIPKSVYIKVMKHAADNRDGWHVEGGNDCYVSDKNNTILFKGTGYDVRSNGLHLRYADFNKRKIEINDDKIIINSCKALIKQPEKEVRNDLHLNERRRATSWFT